MIRILSLAAAAAVLAAPATTFAQGGDPAFDAFQKICWSSNGDYLAAVKAADADGWRDTQVIAPTPAGVSIQDKQAREKTVGQSTLTLLMTRGLQHTKGGDYGLVTCKLSSNKPDNAVMTEGKAWLGGVNSDNTPPDPTFAMYYVKNTSGTPSYVGPSGAMAAMSANGSFGRLKFQADSDSATFVYEVLSKPKS